MTQSTKEDPRDCWRTPDDFWNVLDKEFDFVADMAASRDNAKCPNWCRDALNIDWSTSGWNWCNPPFSQTRTFVKKAFSEYEKHGARSVVLVSNRITDQRWFTEHIVSNCAIGFVSPRVHFVPPNGIKKSSPTFGTMLLVFGDSPGTVFSILKEGGTYIFKGR